MKLPAAESALERLKLSSAPVAFTATQRLSTAPGRKIFLCTGPA